MLFGMREHFLAGKLNLLVWNCLFIDISDTEVDVASISKTDSKIGHQLIHRRRDT